jgi:hypothetical protein
MVICLACRNLKRGDRGAREVPNQSDLNNKAGKDGKNILLPDLSDLPVQFRSLGTPIGGKSPLIHQPMNKGRSRERRDTRHE